MRKIWLPLLLGLALRLLLMPFTMQADDRFVGDLVAMNVDAREFVQPEGAVDIALYPPLAYYTIYGWQRLISIVVPDIDDLAKDGIIARDTWYSDSLRFLKLFLLKLWYLPFDILCGLLLFRITDDKRAAWLWYLNPIVIFTTAIHGQFDVVPIFFTLLAWDSWRRENFTWAAIALGFGAAFKLYPLLFLAPLLISAPNRDTRIRMGFLAGLVFLLPYAGKLGHYAVQHSYYSFGLAGVVELTQGQAYFLFMAVYTLLLFWLAERFRGAWLGWSWVLILVLYYLQATFDIHYLTWLMPFAVILWLRVPQSRSAWLILLAAAVVMHLRVIPHGYLFPLDYDTYSNQTTIGLWLAQLIPLDLVLRVAHSIIIGTLAWLAYLTWKERDATLS